MPWIPPVDISHENRSFMSIEKKVVMSTILMKLCNALVTAATEHLIHVFCVMLELSACKCKTFSPLHYIILVGVWFDFNELT